MKNAQDEAICSEMSDAMSDLATILYRIGVEPHEIRMVSKLLLEVAMTHYTLSEAEAAEQFPALAL